MVMNPRSKTRVSKLRRSKNASITYTKEEPYALCFYLYVIFAEKSNKTIIKDNDEAIRLFLESVEKINKTERLSAVLESEIRRMEKTNQLTLLQKQETSEMHFDDSSIPYKYEQDKKIDRIMSSFDNIDENTVNLHRLLFISEKPFFSSVINAVVFNEQADYSLSDGIRLSRKCRKLSLTFRKLSFL